MDDDNDDEDSGLEGDYTSDKFSFIQSSKCLNKCPLLPRTMKAIIYYYYFGGAVEGGGRGSETTRALFRGNVVYFEEPGSAQAGPRE